MRIAMPTFGNRVSPRFDCSNSFLVVRTDGQKIVERHELYATDFTTRERISKLLSMGVEVVVCGGIDRWSAESLRNAGVTLYSRVTGTSDEALNALLSGKLAQEPLPGQSATPGNSPRDETPNDGGTMTKAALAQGEQKNHQPGHLWIARIAANAALAEARASRSDIRVRGGRNRGKL